MTQQYCVYTYSDALMTKICDFLLIPSLKLVLVGNGAQNSQDAMFLNLYEIVINAESGLPEFKTHSKIKKESTAKVTELYYNPGL